MKFEQILLVAFLAAVGFYIGGLILGIKGSLNNQRRLATAKDMGWFVETKIVRRENVDSHKLADTRKMKSRGMIETVYKYEINGREKKLKIRTDVTAPKLEKVYYDAENNYRELNIPNENQGKMIVLVPILVFIGVMLIGKCIFRV